MWQNRTGEAGGREEEESTGGRCGQGECVGPPAFLPPSSRMPGLMAWREYHRVLRGDEHQHNRNQNNSHHITNTTQ